MLFALYIILAIIGLAIFIFGFILAANHLHKKIIANVELKDGQQEIGFRHNGKFAVWLVGAWGIKELGQFDLQIANANSGNGCRVDWVGFGQTGFKSSKKALELLNFEIVESGIHLIKISNVHDIIASRKLGPVSKLLSPNVPNEKLSLILCKSSHMVLRIVSVFMILIGFNLALWMFCLAFVF